jgi:hypothetical protein
MVEPAEARDLAGLAADIFVNQSLEVVGAE